VKISGFNPRQGLVKFFWLSNAFFAGVLCLALWFSYSQYLQNAREQEKNITLTLEKSVSGMFEQIDMLLIAMVNELEQDITHGKYNQSSVSKKAAQLAGRVKIFTRITYSDANGNVGSNNGIPQGMPEINIQDRDYFLQLRANPDIGLVTSKPILGRAVGKWVLVFARAHRDPKGKFAGVMYVSVELASFAELFANLQLGKRAVTNLLSDNDYLNLVRYPAPKDASVMGKRILVQNIIDQMKQGRPFVSFIETSKVDNVEKIYALRKLTDWPYFILLGQSTEEVFAPWRNQLYMAIAVLLIFSGLTGAAVWQLRRGWRVQEKALSVLQATLESGDNGILVVDENGKILHRNQRFLRLWRIPSELADSSDDKALISCMLEQLNEPQVFIRSTQAVQDGSGTEYFDVLDFKDGRVLERYSLPMRMGGQMSGRVWSFRDVTDRKNAEELLAHEKALFEAIFRGIQDGIVYANVKQEVIAINPAFTSIFHFNIHDLAGKTTSFFYASQTEYERQGKLRVNLTATEHARPYVVSYRKKGGEVFSGDTLGTVIKDSNGQVLGYIAVIRDITDKLRLEKESLDMRDQLAQATKMESIGHLTAGIAHDFNNMLGAIMGYSELSQHMLAAGKPEAVLPFQEEILKAGTRAKELIAQMLTFSRTSPETKAELAPVTLLTPIVKEVVAMLRSSIPSTVELTCRIETEDLKARIQPVNLHQIILNLGVNARDAMGEYGKIDISLSRYHGDTQFCNACKKPFSGDYARIRVKDSGSGIPEHNLDKIFDPFFTTKGVGKGTGMGLSVVHGLVLAAGGHILVESNAASGTAFHILLPLETSSPRLQDAVEAAAEANIKGARIMVVDDELPLARMLHEYLSSYGAQVISFTDPIKALDAFILNADNIDLVITDEAMPGISGMLLAEKLLIVKPGLPIILCTGYSDHAKPETAAKIGIAGFFHKPLSMNELMQKIMELCAAG